MGQKGCSCTMYVVSMSQIDYVKMKSNLARVLWSSRAKDDCSNFMPPSQTPFDLITEFILRSMNCGRSELMLQHDPHFTLGAGKKQFRELLSGLCGLFGRSKFK